MKTFKPFVEVIQEMKNGDIADCEINGFTSILRSHGTFYSVHPEVGSDMKTSGLPVWKLDPGDLKRRFAIRPRYVDVVEAMKALQERKIVEWYDEATHEKIASLSSGINFEALARHNSEFADRGFFGLAKGKFVIKGD